MYCLDCTVQYSMQDLVTPTGLCTTSAGSHQATERILRSLDYRGAQSELFVLARLGDELGFGFRGLGASEVDLGLDFSGSRGTGDW